VTTMPSMPWGMNDASAWEFANHECVTSRRRLIGPGGSPSETAGASVGRESPDGHHGHAQLAKAEKSDQFLNHSDSPRCRPSWLTAMPPPWHNQKGILSPVAVCQRLVWTESKRAVVDEKVLPEQTKRPIRLFASKEAACDIRGLPQSRPSVEVNAWISLPAWTSLR
jgi:hypothetical protein